MNELLLYSLISIAGLLLLWGIIKPERVYQYPFTIAAAFSFFIIPQAISIYLYPSLAISDTILTRVLIMACLCLIATFIGYNFQANKNIGNFLNFPVNDRRITHIAVFFIIIAFLASFLISRLPSEVRNASQWTGIITIYAFFRNFIYPAFALALINYSKKNNLTNLIILVLPSLLIGQIIIFDGRREATATALLTIGICLLILKNIIPPRSFVISLIISTMIIIPLTGSYRNIAKSGNWNELWDLNPIENFRERILSDSLSTRASGSFELENGALLMDFAEKNNQFTYGATYWNGIIKYYVPGQFVGKEFKESLNIAVESNIADIESNYYGFNYTTGRTMTGIADTFVSFGYFGCLVFMIIGYCYKSLWVAMAKEKTTPAIFLYTLLITPSMIIVTHSSQRFIQDIILSIVLLLFMRIYAYDYGKKVSPHQVEF